MRLSNKAIKDFQVIFEKDYGITLSDDEANQSGLNLLKLVCLAIADDKELPDES